MPIDGNPFAKGSSSETKKKPTRRRKPVKVTGNPFKLSDPNEKKLGPFIKGSKTSREAALSAYPKQGTQRWSVLSSLLEEPKTRDELANALGLSPNAVRPRVVELIDGGWVEETSQTRKSDAGKDSAVLRITDAGRAKIPTTCP